MIPILTMKTVLAYTLFLFCVVDSETEKKRVQRGYFAYPTVREHISTYSSLNIPLELTQYYSSGVNNFLHIPQGNTLDTSKQNVLPIAVSNSVEKPVQEAQDYVPPPQSSGPAIIPLQPPPAVPVNAAAANVPANNGAVFLGSGSIGVINLGNGAYALGSGGIGYSDTRQQPRPSLKSPLYPPLPANPNLVPAARPSQIPAPIPQASPASRITPNGYHFNHPLFMQAQPRLVDQNGYEMIPSDSVGFGTQSPRARPLKTTNSYATPTATQIQIQNVHPSQLPQPGFGEPLPRLPVVGLQYFKT